jgi:hypothetical protein
MVHTIHSTLFTCHLQSQLNVELNIFSSRYILALLRMTWIRNVQKLSRSGTVFNLVNRSFPSAVTLVRSTLVMDSTDNNNESTRSEDASTVSSCLPPSTTSISLGSDAGQPHDPDAAWECTPWACTIPVGE